MHPTAAPATQVAHHWRVPSVLGHAVSDERRKVLQSDGLIEALVLTQFRAIRFGRLPGVGKDVYRGIRMIWWS
jgi:hypothetical protein